MSVGERDFEIIQGATFDPVVRWGSSEVVFKALASIDQSAPALVGCPLHGLVENWPVSFTGIKGMTQLNAKADPPGVDDLYNVSVIDPNTFALKRVSSALFTAYMSGGYVRYYLPVDMTGMTARLIARKNIKDVSPLLTLDTSNGGIVIDNVTKKIALFMSATATAALTWTRAIYNLEMVHGALNDPSAYVDRILQGTITVSKEAAY